MEFIFTPHIFVSRSNLIVRFYLKAIEGGKKVMINQKNLLTGMLYRGSLFLPLSIYRYKVGQLILTKGYQVTEMPTFIFVLICFDLTGNEC